MSERAVRDRATGALRDLLYAEGCIGVLPDELLSLFEAMGLAVVDRARFDRLRDFAGNVQLRHLTEPLTPLSYIGGELDKLHGDDLERLS
jgi:hypothetical protein